MAVAVEENINVSSCSICLEDYTEPRTLPCLHTYCSGCLKDYISSKLQQVREKNYFRCPTCRKSIKCSSSSSAFDLDELVEQFPIDSCMNILVELQKDIKHLMVDENELKTTRNSSEKTPSFLAKKENLSFTDKSLVFRERTKKAYNHPPSDELQLKKAISSYVQLQNKIIPLFKKTMLYPAQPNVLMELQKTGGKDKSTESKTTENEKIKKTDVTQSNRSLMKPSEISTKGSLYRYWNYRGLLCTKEGNLIVINIHRKCLTLYDKEGRELDYLALVHEPYGMCWYKDEQIVVTASCQKLYIIKLSPWNNLVVLRVFRTSIQYSDIDVYSDSHFVAVGYSEPLLKFVSLASTTTVELIILTLPFHRLNGHKCIHLTSKRDIYIADTSNSILYCFKPNVSWTSYNIIQPTCVVSIGKDVYISQGLGIDKILRLDSETDKLSCFMSPRDGLVNPCSMAVVTNKKGVALACDKEGKLVLGYWSQL
ncbi:hypothetical protein Ahia01_000216000 [Argonauta hians]